MADTRNLALVGLAGLVGVALYKALQSTTPGGGPDSLLAQLQAQGTPSGAPVGAETGILADVKKWLGLGATAAGITGKAAPSLASLFGAEPAAESALAVAPESFPLTPVEPDSVVSLVASEPAESFAPDAGGIFDFDASSVAKEGSDLVRAVDTSVNLLAAAPLEGVLGIAGAEAAIAGSGGLTVASTGAPVLAADIAGMTGSELGSAIAAGAIESGATSGASSAGSAAGLGVGAAGLMLAIPGILYAISSYFQGRAEKADAEVTQREMEETLSWFNDPAILLARMQTIAAGDTHDLPASTWGGVLWNLVPQLVPGATAADYGFDPSTLPADWGQNVSDDIRSVGESWEYIGDFGAASYPGYFLKRFAGYYAARQTWPGLAELRDVRRQAVADWYAAALARHTAFVAELNAALEATKSSGEVVTTYLSPPIALSLYRQGQTMQFDTGR